jgi:hypothetical protein
MLIITLSLSILEDEQFCLSVVETENFSSLVFVVPDKGSNALADILISKSYPASASTIGPILKLRVL